jgi:hypothetical protein
LRITKVAPLKLVSQAYSRVGGLFSTLFKQALFQSIDNSLLPELPSEATRAVLNDLLVRIRLVSK